MKTTIWALALAAVAGAGVSVFARPVAAPQPTEPKVSVELGVEIAARGDELRLPVILNARGEAVRSLEVAFSFPGKKLTFQSAAAPSDRKDAAVEIAADAAPGGTDEKQSGQLRVTAKSGQLADGIVALLVFKVPKEAEPGDVTVTNTPKVGVGDSAGQAAARGKDGLVTILDTPPAVISCLFYMH
jgi:hypothetical protein